MEEKKTFHVNGYLGLLILIIGMIGGAYLFYLGVTNESGLELVLSIFIWLIAILFISSLTIVGPNQAKAILFLGNIWVRSSLMVCLLPRP